MNQKKLIIILAVAFIAIPAIIVTVIATNSAINSAKVRFITAPVEIVVSYDNEAIQVTNEEIISLPPGEYKFGFSRQGFQMIEETHTLVKDETLTIPIILNPVTSEAESEMEKEENQVALQGVADYNHHLEEEAALNDPTVSYLPYENYLFSIDYKPNPDKSKDQPEFIITIDAPDVYKMSAIRYLIELGYSPSDFIYQFKNYQNPFAPQKEQS